jgi:hypothetical protein
MELNNSKYQSVSFRDCMSGGWSLFCKNWLWAAGFCFFMLCAEMLRKWLFQAVFINYLLEGTGPPPRITQFAATLPIQLAVSILQFSAMVFLAAKSLIMLSNRIVPVHELLRGKIVKLILLWLSLELIKNLYSFVYLPFWQYLDNLFQTDYDRALTIMSVTNTMFRIISYTGIAMQLILMLVICHIVSGNSRNFIRDSFSTVKRVWGKLLIFFAMVIVFSAGMTMMFYLRRLTPGLPIREFTDILKNAALLFQVLFITVLYFCSRHPVVSGEVETEEAKEMGEVFRSRVEPSLDFADAGEFYCGLARVRQPHLLGKGKWGYAGTNGRLVIDFTYDEAGDFHDGIAAVKEGRYEYYIGTDGKMVIPVEYEQAGRFQDGLAVVSMDFNWFVIDRGGEAKLLPYDDVYNFSEGLAVVRNGKKWLYINKGLKPVFSAEYDDVWSFYDGLAMVEKDGKVGYINTNGQLTVPLRYDNAQPFSEGLAAVMTTAGGKWGYIDRNGREAIPAAFEGADFFRQGRAAVCSGGKYGHIDTDGTFVTPPEYESAGAFCEGFAAVVASSKDLTPGNAGHPVSFLGQNITLAGGATYGYVDLDGNECTSLMYQEARPFSEGLAWVKTDSGWGILELNNE